MPYSIRSTCPSCRQGDEFRIGHWQMDRGVFVCRQGCRCIVNIPVAAGLFRKNRCPNCGKYASDDELFDYTRSIAYFRGTEALLELLRGSQPGPLCPKCGKAYVTFENQAHLSVGPPELGARKYQGRGQAYLEKVIFLYNLEIIRAEFELGTKPLLEFYRIDAPDAALALMKQLKPLSLPILLDIWGKLIAELILWEMNGEKATAFRPSHRFQQDAQRDPWLDPKVLQRVRERWA